MSTVLLCFLMLSIGACIGLVVAALCASAHKGDDQ